jgi:D-beta-D-heptose 7-phosphate kinase/D-beta-D-heptose 1-phosphate adenosyltransferase
MKKIFKVGDDFHLPSSKIVFTNGCFDILHPGHLDYLKKARALGDFLVVGLNSDHSITVIKGEDRPINDFRFRSKMLSYFDFIDFIIEFDGDTPIDLIKCVQPHILVKGADYLGKNVVGTDIVLEKDGKIVFLDFIQEYSSTKIINKILDRYSNK